MVLQPSPREVDAQYRLIWCNVAMAVIELARAFPLGP